MSEATLTRPEPQDRPAYPMTPAIRATIDYVGADVIEWAPEFPAAICVARYAHLVGNGDTERERMENLRDALLYGAELLDQALRSES